MSTFTLIHLHVVLLPIANIQLSGAAVFLKVEVEIGVGEEQVVELVQGLGHHLVADVCSRCVGYPRVYLFLHI
jgi:hypothetical protein